MTGNATLRGKGRPNSRLGCERLEDRVNPAGWLDDYAAWFDRNIGGNWYNSTVGAATDWTVHAVGFTDETLATASDWQLLGGTAVVAVPVGIALFAGGEVVLGVGTFGGAAATTTTTVAVGGSAAEVTTVNGVATVEIGFLQNASREFMRAVVNAAREQGANTLVVETGPVVNADLAIKLGLAAQRGETILGGTVSLVPSATGPGTVPLFRIVWQAIPAL
ncbi:MAG: hypothetical protein K2P78_02605 [Gemmataceae bacterium]|nr:hypothetical protein [Gemmataceae bacterium]